MTQIVILALIQRPRQVLSFLPYAPYTKNMTVQVSMIKIIIHSRIYKLEGKLLLNSLFCKSFKSQNIILQFMYILAEKCMFTTKDISQHY